MRRTIFVPDLVLWRRDGNGGYTYCDGLRRVVRNGNLWQPLVRPPIESEWQPAQRFKSGAVMCYTTLTVAQQNALRSQPQVTNDAPRTL